ncbi:cytochrome c3 family protein [Planctomycetaceae bacterium SH139]
MSRSIAPVDIAAERARLAGEATPIGTPKHHYQISIRENELWHTERMIDADGEEIFADGIEIDYVVGSGKRAFAYLASRDQLLFMSPLNWYSDDQVYDFAPGHSLDDPRRLSRRVTDDCLSCHAGQVNELERNTARFQSPALLHAAIGCENCHGPGEQHVQFHHGSTNAQDTIVNPDKLDHEQREAICYQCHLHAPARILRPNRSQFDFRPGDRLEDIWAMMVTDAGIAEDGTTKAVSHVQQMHASECFQGSDGRMGCTSCHDPHAYPSPEERVAYYRNRCLSCHDLDACETPTSERQAVGDSCFSCHMPARTAQRISHVSQTDHRVIVPRTDVSNSKNDGQPLQANDQPAAPSNGQRTASADLQFFWNSADSLPEWEQQRSLGMALWLAGSHQGGRPNLEIVEQLAPLAEQTRKDGPMLTVLGAFWLQYQSPERARYYFEAAREDANVRENVLSNLLTIYYLSSQWQAALPITNELLKIDPKNARTFALRADILANLNQVDAALAAGEQALTCNPTLTPVRKWLIEQYRQQGDTVAAERHAALLSRIETASRQTESRETE